MSSMMGRPTVFKGKAKYARVQGFMTPSARVAFDKYRRKLEALFFQVTGRRIEPMSDSDVVESLVWGFEATERYIRHHHKPEGAQHF